jgi:hypothetical protein
VIIQGIIARKTMGEKFETTRKEIGRYLRTSGANQVIKELNKTTVGWSEAPSFESRVTFPYSGTRIRLAVTAKGRGKANWERVNNGTGPRVITSRKGLMTFQTGYSPRTQPGGRYGGSGGRYGNTVYRRRSVGHFKPHRIEPRDFVGEVLKITQEPLKLHIDSIIIKNM